MSSRNWLTGWDPRLLPRLDQLDVATPTPTLPDENFVAEAPAPVMTPAGLPKRTPGASLDDDLDAPIPYVPVDVEPVPIPGDDLRCPTCTEHPGWAHGDTARRNEPRDVCRVCLGSGTRQHGFTNSSGGVVPSTPAPSDGTNSLVELDREEAWLEYARHAGLSDEYAATPNSTSRLAFMAGWNAAVPR